MEKNLRSKEGKKEGYWEYYYINGKLAFKGNFKNGKREGYWEVYLIKYSRSVLQSQERLF